MNVLRLFRSTTTKPIVVESSGDNLCDVDDEDCLASGDVQDQTSRKPSATVKQPYATVKQPYVTVKQPYVSIKQPYITVKKTFATVKQPYVTSHNAPNNIVHTRNYISDESHQEEEEIEEDFFTTSTSLYSQLHLNTELTDNSMSQNSVSNTWKSVRSPPFLSTSESPHNSDLLGGINAVDTHSTKEEKDPPPDEEVENARNAESTDVFKSFTMNVSLIVSILIAISILFCMLAYIIYKCFGSKNNAVSQRSHCAQNNVEKSVPVQNGRVLQNHNTVTTSNATKKDVKEWYVWWLYDERWRRYSLNKVCISRKYGLHWC